MDCNRSCASANRIPARSPYSSQESIYLLILSSLGIVLVEGFPVFRTRFMNSCRPASILWFNNRLNPRKISAGVCSCTSIQRVLIANTAFREGHGHFATTTTPLFPSSQEYHQQTIPNNSSTTTGPVAKTRRCPNIPSMIPTTTSILRTLLVMCRTILLAMVSLHSWPSYHL